MPRWIIEWRRALDILIDQDELRESARRVLDRHIDRQAFLVKPSVGGAFDRSLWKIIAELGWLGLTIPEERGGLGQPFSVLSTLYFDLGRALSGQPFIGAVIGLEAVSHHAATGVAAELVEPGLSGDAIIVSVTTGTGSLALKSQDGTQVVEGTIHNVLDAAHATHLLVPIDGDNNAIALIALPHPGVIVSPRETWDLTRQIADVEFHHLALRDEDVILRGASADVVRARMNAHFDLALACDALGGGNAIFEETLAYMHQRHQFNRPIASFQALKHRCADLKAGLEASRALVDAACRAESELQAEWQTKAACARLYAGSVYRNVTEDCVQLHGGIGFTWEIPCHLFLKRARLSEVLGGTAEQRKDKAAPALFALSGGKSH